MDYGRFKQKIPPLCFSDNTLAIWLPGPPRALASPRLFRQFGEDITIFDLHKGIVAKTWLV
jgi:hypothetical protein